MEAVISSPWDEEPEWRIPQTAKAGQPYRTARSAVPSTALPMVTASLSPGEEAAELPYVRRRAVKQ